MVGLCMVTRRFCIPWLCQTLNPTQMNLCNQKECRWYWKRGVCGQEVVYVSNAQRTHAIRRLLLAVPLILFQCNLILLNKSHLFKRPSKMLDTCAFSSQ